MTLRAPLAVLPLLASTGCYFFYPEHIPKLPGPLIQEGETISIERSEKVSYSSCTDSELKADKCVRREGEWRRRDVTYKATASYGGRALTQGEFYQLTIPTYNDDIRAVMAEKGTCNLSKIPSTIAFVGGLFAMVVLATGDSITDNKDTQLKLYGVGAGAVVLGFAASYPLGGYACRRADKRGMRMEGAGLDASARKEFSSSNESRIDKIVDLADAFNRAHAAQPSPGEPDAPAPDAPEATAPEATAPVGPEATAEAYTVGDKVNVEWKGKSYPATIIKVQGADRYRIHYDGYKDNWDEDVGPDRILSRR